MMLKQLSYKKKNRILIILSVLLLWLSWEFAFKKTYGALNLNSELALKSEDDPLLTHHPGYLNEKSLLLSKLVETYTADSVQWQNDFWLTASGLIASEAVKVIYEPEQKASQDTAGRVCRQQIVFESDYKKLVITLDSLSQTKALGYLTAAQIQRVENRKREGPDKLRLKATFSIIKSSKRP